jgi:hypothetical protein
MSATPSQVDVCARYGSKVVASTPQEKLGVALATLEKIPLNALRHRSAGGTCGWYIWGGETLSEDPEFFQPLHVEHMSSRCPEILPYLALAPGWRVLLAPGHTDAWYDPALLDV